MNIRNNIEISSRDSYGENYQKQFEILGRKEELLQREYEYLDEFGKTKISIKNNLVEIYRAGLVNSKQTFILNKKTSFIYITKEFRGKYEIFTRKMEIKKDEVFLEYDIIEGGGIINSIYLNMSLRYKI